MLRYVNSKFTEFDTSVIYHVLILCFCSFLLYDMSFKVLSNGSARTKMNIFCANILLIAFYVVTPDPAITSD